MNIKIISILTVILIAIVGGYVLLDNDDPPVNQTDPIIQFTLTYDKNSGNDNVTIPAFTIHDDGAIVVVADDPNRGGYSLSGWNIQQDGSGIMYYPSSIIIMDSNITLYAQWTVGYTLSYNANSGNDRVIPTVPISTTHIPGTSVIVPGEIERSGWYFVEWNALPGGGNDTYRPIGSSITMNSDITLYAIWEN